MSPVPGHQPAESVVEVSEDGEEWTVVRDSRATTADATDATDATDAPHALIVLDAPRRVRFVRVTGGRMPFDGVFALSGVRVFGQGDGDTPRQVRA